MARDGRARRTPLRWVVAVLTLTLAGACVVLAVILLGLSALCDATGDAGDSASCTRELVFQAARAAAAAVPLGAIGAIALGWGRR